MRHAPAEKPVSLDFPGYIAAALSHCRQNIVDRRQAYKAAWLRYRLRGYHSS